MPNGFTVRKGKKMWVDKDPRDTEEIDPEARITWALKKLAKEWAREPFETFGAGDYSDYDI